VPGGPGGDGGGTRGWQGEFFIDNLLVQFHLIIEMIWWTGLAPWEFELYVAGRRGGVVSDSLPSGKDVASYQVSVSLSFLRCTCIQRDSFIDNLLVRI